MPALRTTRRTIAPARQRQRQRQCQCQRGTATTRHPAPGDGGNRHYATTAPRTTATGNFSWDGSGEQQGLNSDFILFYHLLCQCYVLYSTSTSTHMFMIYIVPKLSTVGVLYTKIPSHFYIQKPWPGPSQAGAKP